jgi:hypothetical protein
LDRPWAIAARTCRSRAVRLASGSVCRARANEHPYLRPAVTDHHCGTQALVEVCRRHPDVDDAHVGDLLRDRPQQCFTVADRSGHPQPLLLKQANQALAQQDRVFGDDNTQRLSHHRAPRSSARSGPRED